MTDKQLVENNHICPWWLTFMFDNPARKLIQSPEKLMGDLLHTGDTALDIGCGMGYFTIGMAKLVGENGRVTAVDLQKEMLAGVEKRAQRHGLADRVTLQRATPTSLGLSEPVDFVLTFWMVHEVPNKENFLHEIKALLKPGGHYLFVEPKVHVGAKAFQATVDLAEQIGFVPVETRKVAISRAMLFTI